METKVTTKDLIGDLAGFPIEVVEKMLRKQYNQVNKMDVTVFQNNKRADERHEGFRWRDTIEGHEFWRDVICHEKFDVFFAHYPKLSKNVYIHGDSDNGEKVIEELKKRGGINKYDYVGSADALYFIDPVTNYIEMAAKVEKSFQNLLISNYTEISPCENTTVELTMEEIAEKLGVDVDKLRIKK